MHFPKHYRVLAKHSAAKGPPCGDLKGSDLALQRYLGGNSLLSLERRTEVGDLLGSRASSNEVDDFVIRGGVV